VWRCDDLGIRPAAKADFVGWRVFAGLKVQLPLLKQGASTFAEATADRPLPVASGAQCGRRLVWRCDDIRLRSAAKADFVGWRVFAGLKSSSPC